MNYKKIDAALIAALQQKRVSDNFSVFIHLKHLGNEEKNYLKNLKNKANFSFKDDASLVTANLSGDQISDLSEQEWVKHIELSTRLNLLRNTRII